MPRVLIVVGLAAVAFAVYTIVDCALTERARVRGLPRAAWIAVIALLPFIGGALWFLIGSGRVQPSAATTRPLGPDDDPDFLRVRRAPNRPADEEEWRRLEQELAALDSDADSDDDGDARRR